MTVHPAIIRGRLAHLGHVLAQLQRLLAIAPSDRADALYQLALERALQVAAEVVLDLGQHILAGRGCVVPSTYREIVPALVHENIFDPELGQRLEGLAGLRNILVHDYVAVNHALLWNLAESRLDDLEAARAAIENLPELLNQSV